MFRKLDFISEAFLKRYSIPIGIIGLSLTAMSTFQVKMDGTFEAHTFWVTTWLLIALIILVIISLQLAVNKINTIFSSKFNIGNLPPIFSLCAINEKQNAKIILHEKEGVSLQKDTVISVIYIDDEQGDLELGLGVVTHLQSDGKIAFVATPKRNMEPIWNRILNNPTDFYSRLQAKTLIDRNYINDDYLYKENYEILNLSTSSDSLSDDGAGVNL